MRVDFDPEPGLLDVNIDDEGAARATAEHLVALGHRRIGIALPHDHPGDTGPEARANACHYVHRSRLAGWRAGLEAAGIDWSSVPVASGPDKLREAGRVAGARLLDRADRPTAIIALSDVLAIGVLEAAARARHRRPRRAVGHRLRRRARGRVAPIPPLTTIRQPHRPKGSEAVRLLLEGPEAESVLLPTELVVRASTAPAP